MARTQRLRSIGAVTVATLAALATVSASDARAEDVAALTGGGGGCEVTGLRMSIADAGAISIVELSAHLRVASGPTNAAPSSGSIPASIRCTVDWSLISISSPDGVGGSPTVAIAESFVDHTLELPVMLADGVETVTPRGVRLDVGPGGVTVALRLVVEGTDDGLSVTLPRSALPKRSAQGARFERRTKSARAATARFGRLGSFSLKPTPPGLAGGVGPTMSLDGDALTAEVLGGGAPLDEATPGVVQTLNALRDAMPRRVLDLSPDATDGWDAIARRAYAASLHSDPVVAALGARTLAWMADGLKMQIPPLSSSAIPASLRTSFGDVDARTDRRFGSGGHLSPLGRTSIVRLLIAARPWADAARARAAKDAVARLTTLSVADLAGELMPAIVDTGAPVDPPSEALLLAPDVPTSAPKIATPAALPKHLATTPARPSLARRARHVLAWMGVLLAALGLVLLFGLFERRAPEAV